MSIFSRFSSYFRYLAAFSGWSTRINFLRGTFDSLVSVVLLGLRASSEAQFYQSAPTRRFYSEAGRLPEMCVNFLWVDIVSSRHSRRQARWAVLLCSASREECFSFFHSTLLEGAARRGAVLYFLKNAKLFYTYSDNVRNSSTWGTSFSARTAFSSRASDLFYRM